MTTPKTCATCRHQRLSWMDLTTSFLTFGYLKNDAYAQCVNPRAYGVRERAIATFCSVERADIPDIELCGPSATLWESKPQRFQYLRSLFPPKPGPCEICRAYSDDLRNGLCDECHMKETAW